MSEPRRCGLCNAPTTVVNGRTTYAPVTALVEARANETALRAALEHGVLLPEPEGDGWDVEVRMSRRYLHDMLNRHAVERVNAALTAALASPEEPR